MGEAPTIAFCFSDANAWDAQSIPKWKPNRPPCASRFPADVSATASTATNPGCPISRSFFARCGIPLRSTRRHLAHEHTLRSRSVVSHPGFVAVEARQRHLRSSFSVLTTNPLGPNHPETDPLSDLLTYEDSPTPYPRQAHPSYRAFSKPSATPNNPATQVRQSPRRSAQTDAA